MSSVPAGISWLLVPVTVPGAKALHFRATSSCPHHVGEHYVVAPTALTIRGQIDGLGALHRVQAHCHCPHGELLIKTEEKTDA